MIVIWQTQQNIVLRAKLKFTIKLFELIQKKEGSITKCLIDKLNVSFSWGVLGKILA